MRDYRTKCVCGEIITFMPLATITDVPLIPFGEWWHEKTRRMSCKDGNQAKPEWEKNEAARAE